MKKSLSLLSFAFAGVFAMSLQARAEDPIPPKPPGASTLPPAPVPAATTASTPESTAPGAAGKSRMMEFVQMLKEKVGVTDEQLQKMKPIFVQEGEKMKGLKDDTAMTKEQKRDKYREIIMGMIEGIKPILTPEQFAKFQEEMEKRRAARAQKPQ